jgi:hypothetical protein
MIIRVLHEGQYELEGDALQRVNALDEQIFAAVVGGDPTGYTRVFDQTLQVIRRDGRPLAADDLRGSDLVLPAADSSLEEIRALFQQEGLIPS